MSKKWKLLESKPIYESKWMSVFNNTYELPDGSVGNDYLHLSRPNYVLIVAINEKREIIVEKNYRRGVNDFVYELPAGWIHKNESSKEAAERELIEETGFESNVEILGEIYPQPAFSSMRAYVAYAKINTKAKGDQTLGHDEYIDYQLISLPDLHKMIEKGEIKDMGLLAGLKLLETKSSAYH
jgi:ADP-ribose pyrophosphatase